MVLSLQRAGRDHLLLCDEGDASFFGAVDLSPVGRASCWTLVVGNVDDSGSQHLDVEATLAVFDGRMPKYV